MNQTAWKKCRECGAGLPMAFWAYGFCNAYHMAAYNEEKAFMLDREMGAGENQPNGENQ